MSLDFRTMLSSSRNTGVRAWLRSPFGLIVSALALVGIAVELRGVPWSEATAAFSAVHFGWLALAMASFVSIFVFWTIQWFVLIGKGGRSGLTTAAKIVLVTAAIENSLPFPSGFVTAVMLLRNRAALSYGAALAVLAMDQWVTGVAKVAMVGWAVLLVPMPQPVRAAALALFIVLVGASLALVIVARAHQNVLPSVLAVRSQWGNILRRITAWSQQLKTGLTAWEILAVIALAIAKKVPELAAVMAIQRGCGMTPSVGIAAAVIASLSFATMLPVGPANIGVYEATVFLTYESFHVDTATALIAAVIQHTLALLASLAPGYLLLAWGLVVPDHRTNDIAR
jgi:uncharacterized membrane protein YbhN (UPF0104 family)